MRLLWSIEKGKSPQKGEKRAPLWYRDAAKKEMKKGNPLSTSGPEGSLDNFATAGSTVGMVTLAKVRADKNQVGGFQISASEGNQACQGSPTEPFQFAILRMDEIRSHHFETMQNHGFVGIYRWKHHSRVLRWCRSLSIHSMVGNSHSV